MRRFFLVVRRVIVSEEKQVPLFLCTLSGWLPSIDTVVKSSKMCGSKHYYLFVKLQVNLIWVNCVTWLTHLHTQELFQRGVKKGPWQPCTVSTAHISPLEVARLTRLYRFNNVCAEQLQQPQSQQIDTDDRPPDKLGQPFFIFCILLFAVWLFICCSPPEVCV